MSYDLILWKLRIVMMRWNSEGMGLYAELGVLSVALVSSVAIRFSQGDHHRQVAEQAAYGNEFVAPVIQPEQDPLPVVELDSPEPVEDFLGFGQVSEAALIGSFVLGVGMRRKLITIRSNIPKFERDPLNPEERRTFNEIARQYKQP